MEYKIHKRENLYFTLKIIFTFVILVWFISLLAKFLSSMSSLALPTLLTFIIYFLMIVLFIFFQKILLVAYMKGNGICVSENQFPEVYKEYKVMVEKLGIKKEPQLFILQQGGLLNAFAIRFSGRNYIAIYSDVFSVLTSDLDTLKFVIGHELAHVKRNHMSKRFWTFPSSAIPFLTPAYSRMCEYTCDNIGTALVKENYIDGLVLLAAGKELYKNVNVENYIEESDKNNTAVVKFVGLFLSHPYLPRRIKNINTLMS